jgi:hypothetical protein
VKALQRATGANRSRTILVVFVEIGVVPRRRTRERRGLLELCISHMHDLCNVAVFNLRLTKPKTRSRVGIVIWYASHPWRLPPVHTWGFVVDARFFRPPRRPKAGGEGHDHFRVSGSAQRGTLGRALYWLRWTDCMYSEYVRVVCT